MTKGIYICITEDGIWAICINEKDYQITAFGKERRGE